MKIVIIGLSITSSWGNGHATTYRSLIRALSKKGHTVIFLEKDVPYYAAHRDLPSPPFCEAALYTTFSDLRSNYARQISEADLVIIGSYVAEGVEIGRWVLSIAQGITAFYDIDTPVTLSKLRRGDHEYIDPYLIARYQLYLSFSGGPVLQQIENEFHSPAARALYCSADPDLYYPMEVAQKWDIGYLGTYSNDRQPAVDRLLIEVARKWENGKFVLAGSSYPEQISWPSNIERIDHLPPGEHCLFYNSQRFALNITRRDMIQAGYSPSVRLFEAAACGVPVISDKWPGIEEFFMPDIEILLADTTGDVLDYLRNISAYEANFIGENARQKILRHHTADKRAEELEKYVAELKEHAYTIPESQ